jgi:hypothetical protein
MLVLWAGKAHITIISGARSPPISALECSPLEVLPLLATPTKLSRIFFDPAFLLPFFRLLPALPQFQSFGAGAQFLG